MNQEEILKKADPKVWSELIVQGQDILADYALKLVLFALGVAAVYFMARWMESLSKSALNRAKVDLALQSFLSNIAKWTILVAGIVSCLSIFGIQTASFAALLAGVGLAIGMALQGTLGNFAAGVCLLLFRPFKIGDFVVTGGQSGTVTTIDIFNTVLNTVDNRRIIVPNGQVFGSIIENVTYNPNRRVEVLVGTEYSADLQKTREVLWDAIKRTDKILDEPESAVALLELGGSSVNWAVRVWVNTADFWPVKDALTKSVKESLDSAGIGIPFPQMDVHMRSGKDVSPT